MVKERYSVEMLAKALNISPTAARAIGKNGLLSQIGELSGQPQTRCEDSRTAGQYTGDLETDFSDAIKRRLNE
jgi:hypothetical protein